MRWIRRTSLAPAATAALLAPACLPSPVEVGDIEGAQKKEAIRSDPVAWIASPAYDERVPSDVLFGSPGLEVTFAGEFVAGHTLHFSASPQDDPGRTFHVERFPLSEPENPGPTRVRGEQSITPGADRIMLRLRVRDEADVLISLDSVRIRLR